jgi:hypothetical protein
MVAADGGTVNGWLLGYLVGTVVVAVVVAVLVTLIALAHRTAGKAEAIVGALHDSRDGTAALWQVERTVVATERIVEAAASAREALAGGGRR